MSRAVKWLFFKIFSGGLAPPFDPGRKSMIFLKISVETGFYGIFFVQCGKPRRIS